MSGLDGVGELPKENIAHARMMHLVDRERPQWKILPLERDQLGQEY